MVMEWLQRKLSIEEAEKKHMVSDEELGPDPVPFGFQNDKWLMFSKQFREGDELWEFNSPEEFWDCLCGRAGLCIVR